MKGTNNQALAGPTKTGYRVENDNDTAPAILASAITDVAEAAKKLLGGPLKRRTIVVLLQDSIGTGITKKQIEQVLDAAAELKRNYVVA